MMEKEHLMWKDGEVKELLHSAIFDIVSIERATESGKHGTFLKMINPNWVSLIPWRRREDGVPVFLMEEQFRHGSSSVTREFPAGLVDEGEDILEAGKREFLEETGCVGDFTELGNVNPNPAYMCNRQVFFLVENYRKVSGQD
ncbi:MAG: NUDIX hydrolase, partial [Spirochaetales bacterium]|nr:NUDIX hydrolase [Candidatus Physcosoma equi]